MAKHRPHGPKGHSSGRPKSGQRSLSGARPGNSGPRKGPRPGGGGPHGPKQGGPHGPKHRGPDRRERPATVESRPREARGPAKPERLQKFLAAAGLGSRRGCEELIVQGRVTINGEVARELGTRVEPNAKVAVDGEPIRRESLVYYAVHKPEGYVSTNSDPSGRPRVVDLVAEIPQRVYTVGRLDEDSTGLMILTNDGELANRLAHPKYGVEKLYQALVAGTPAPESLSKLTEGVWLSDGKVRAKRVRIAGRRGQATMLELVLAEGKKREIRRMLAKLGHKVMSLHRTAIGPIALKGLPPGESRPLTRHEVELLQKVGAGATLTVPGFPDVEPSRPSRGPRKGPQGVQPPAERRRHRDDEEGHGHGPHRGPRRPAAGRPAGPARPGVRPPRRPAAEAEAPEPLQPAPERRRRREDGEGQGRGPYRGPDRRPAAGRPAGPGARPPRRPPIESEAPEPLQPAPERRRRREDGEGQGRGPYRGPDRRPAAGRPAGPARPGARPPRRPPIEAEAEGPKPTQRPETRRPAARPAGPGPRKRDEGEPKPRRRIIGLEGPAAAAVGGAEAARKRPMSRKPKPPRSALGPRPGRMRPPRPDADQDDEQ